MEQKSYIKVYYLVYINKTKEIKRVRDYIDYKYRPNRLRRVDDFSTIRQTIVKEYKTTDIVWIESIEIKWLNWADWYRNDFEEFLAAKWKKIIS